MSFSQSKLLIFIILNKKLTSKLVVVVVVFFKIQYLSRGIMYNIAEPSLNGALTQHKNKDIKTLKLDN